MKRTFFPVAVTVNNILLLSAAPALALENGKPAPIDTGSSSMAMLKIGKVGSFGSCAGTPAVGQWVPTACHCLESVNNEGIQVRVSGRVYSADSQALSPISDAGLPHLTEKVTNATLVEVSRDIPTPGRMGVLYGRNSNSSMTRSGQLPMTKTVVNELLGGGLTEGIPGEAAPGAAQIESVSVETESILADAAMMPMIQSVILDMHSVSGAGMQGDNSGGPLFVDGKLADLATAGTSNGDPDLPPPSAAITTLVGTADQIDDITSGRGTESVLTVENTPAPPKTVWTSGDRVWACLAVACVGTIIAATGLHIRNE